MCELCSTNGKTPAEVNRGLTISRLSRPRKTLCVRIRYDSPARWLARWGTTPARRWLLLRATSWWPLTTDLAWELPTESFGAIYKPISSKIWYTFPVVHPTEDESEWEISTGGDSRPSCAGDCTGVQKRGLSLQWHQLLAWRARNEWPLTARC